MGAADFTTLFLLTPKIHLQESDGAKIHSQRIDVNKKKVVKSFP